MLVRTPQLHTPKFAVTPQKISGHTHSNCRSHTQTTGHNKRSTTTNNNNFNKLNVVKEQWQQQQRQRQQQQGQHIQRHLPLWGDVDDNDTYSEHNINARSSPAVDMLRADSPPATSTPTLGTIVTTATMPTTRHRQQQERRPQPHSKRNGSNWRARRLHR